MNEALKTRSDVETGPAGAATPIESDAEHFGRPRGGWRRRVYAVIFEAETPAGKLFDVALIVAILVSVAVVIADSIESVAAAHGPLLDGLEWAFTVLFSLEYALRLACVRRPWRYARSFYGVIDLLSILPTYVALLVPNAQMLLDVRILRLLRVLRVFKLTAYFGEFSALGEALLASRRKILVFISIVAMIVLVMGTLMYVVEGPANGYTSIPAGIYWAIVTMTTVGYGDITPHTPLGRVIASVMMLLGWGILAVPTGIVSAEMTAQRLGAPRGPSTRTCPECLTEGHSAEAKFCQDCGARLRPLTPN